MDPFELVAHELKDIKERLDRLELAGKLSLDGTKWQEGAEKLDNAITDANRRKP